MAWSDEARKKSAEVRHLKALMHRVARVKSPGAYTSSGSTLSRALNAMTFKAGSLKPFPEQEHHQVGHNDQKVRDSRVKHVQDFNDELKSAVAAFNKAGKPEKQREAIASKMHDFLELEMTKYFDVSDEDVQNYMEILARELWQFEGKPLKKYKSIKPLLDDMHQENWD